MNSDILKVSYSKYVNSDSFSWCLQGVTFSTSASARVNVKQHLRVPESQTRAAANTWHVYPFADRVELGSGGVKISAWLECAPLIRGDKWTLGSFIGRPEPGQGRRQENGSCWHQPIDFRVLIVKAWKLYHALTISLVTLVLTFEHMGSLLA